MKRTVFVAVDPGINGAAAIRWEDGKVETREFDEETAVDLVQVLDCKHEGSGTAVEFVVEEVGGFVGKAQPGSAMFVFGANYGFWRGLIQGNGFPLRLVRPTVWQKGIRGVAGTKGPERKRKLKEEAARLFPELKPTLKTADALLLLDFAERNFWKK